MNLPLLGERVVSWVSNAVERRLNAENFIAANQTPHEVVYQAGLVTVRAYPALGDTAIPLGKDTLRAASTRQPVPVLLVPPLAANSLNFDLLPNRSLVRYLSARGLRVYLVDWGDPDEDHSHLALADYTTRMLPEAIAAVRRHSRNEDISLLGYCMGGLFCLIYAAWSHDERLRNVVTIASPIDYHQIGVAGRLARLSYHPMRLAARFIPFSFDDIPRRWLRIPGGVSAAVFKLTNPLGTVQSYIDLLMNLWDRDYVTEHETLSAWFNDMHDYPGGIVQDFVLRVGVANQMARGRLTLDKAQVAQFDRVEASLLAIAGASDRIVSIEAARKVLDIVGTEDKHFAVFPGGHAGVFAGSQAPSTTWPAAADFLVERSGIDTGRPSRATARLRKKKSGSDQSASRKKPVSSARKRRGASNGMA